MKGAGAVRAAWTRDVKLVHQEAGDVIQIFLLSPRDCVRIAVAAAAGNSYCVALLHAATDFLHKIATAPKSRPALCLCCPRPIRAATDVLVCLAVPGVKNPRHAIGAGVCRHCATSGDLNTKVATAFRNIWPDLRAIEVMLAPKMVQ
jgi:hypothetical protein